MLVPVPEGSDVDGEVQVLPFQGISATQGYLPLASLAPTQPDAVGPRARPQAVPRQSQSGVRPMRDLRPLKQSVAHLPSNHPLRLAPRGEPDWLPHEKTRPKLREWAKYLAWQER